MKKLSLIIALFGLSLGAMAQGNSQGKGKGKNKNKNEYGKHGNRDDNENEHGTVYTPGNSGKSSKNQPKKVQDALYRDYPNASNVIWSKYKGDYTATFGNGIWRSTAVYHANGERRDTRTPVTRQQLPNGTIWDRIFRRDNITPTSYTQIERPSVAERIYRILGGNNTAYFYDANGNRVNYDY
jgi:hypothetical protein